jgi:hypothetical protein
LHPNLITYYDKEEDHDFIYLAVEKCEGSIDDYVKLMGKAKTNPKNWDMKNPLMHIY